ncbi:MAG: zinc-ribbon domain-containing protein [Oscillospiraceae bacterium]
MKTCRNCGRPVQDNYSFCQNCGAPIDGSSMNGTGFVFNDQYSGQQNNFGGNNMNYGGQPIQPGFFDRLLF